MSYACIVFNCILNTYTNRMSVALKLLQRRFLYTRKRQLQKFTTRQNEKRPFRVQFQKINIQQHFCTWGLGYITEEEKEINTILTHLQWADICICMTEKLHDEISKMWSLRQVLHNSNNSELANMNTGYLANLY